MYNNFVVNKSIDFSVKQLSIIIPLVYKTYYYLRFISILSKSLSLRAGSALVHDTWPLVLLGFQLQSFNELHTVPKSLLNSVLFNYYCGAPGVRFCDDVPKPLCETFYNVDYQLYLRFLFTYLLVRSFRPCNGGQNHEIL